MDINDQLQPVIASLLDSLKVSMEQQILDQVTQEVINKIASTEITTIVQQVTAQQLQDRLAKYNFEATSKEQLDALVKRLTEQINNNLAVQANHQISAEITKLISNIDIKTIINAVVESKLTSLVTSGVFPVAGIPHTAVDFKGLNFSGDQISGGIITNFGSTGIDDRSSQVQMTLLDQGVAFESAVFAPSAKIKGTLTVEGDLIVTGDIPSNSPVVERIAAVSADKVKASLNTELFESYSAIIEKNLRENGLDLDIIKQGGREVIKGNQLGYQIIDSNLQRVGMLRDLQTQGEAVFSDTLYVTTRRVGINTIEPSATFVVWDEEVEMVVAKRSQDTGYVGTQRHQRLILGADNKENLVLDPDGSVEIENLRVGNVPMSSASVIPNYDAITGTIVWNESPTIGGPAGWICLGGARWAKFGIIE